MNQKQLKDKTIFYASQVFFLSMLIWFAFRIWGDASVQVPSHVGCLFMLVFYISDGCVWYWVASRHKDYLTSFFTGTSGLRFLLALAILGIYYMVACNAEMTTFLLVFMVYYLVALIHHSVFFSRLSKRI
jgi:hypothetical protein